MSNPRLRLLGSNEREIFAIGCGLRDELQALKRDAFADGERIKAVEAALRQCAMAAAKMDQTRAYVEGNR